MPDADVRPTDEQLAALVDGELEPAERARLEVLAGRDPEIARRLAAQRAARDALRAALPLDRHAAALSPDVGPVAARLAAAAEARRRALAGADAGTDADTRVARLDAARTRREVEHARRSRPGPAAWMAVAASVVLAIAVLVYRVGDVGTADRSAVPAVAELIANDHALHRLLEATPSGTPVGLADADGGATARVLLTFRTADGAYCREFAVRSARTASVAIGCRESGGWRIAAAGGAAPVADPAADRYAVAAAPDDPAIAAAVSRLMAGDALSADEEARLLAGGWR